MTANTTRATLGSRNLRRYLAGQLVSNTGTWMQRAAQDLLALHLTGNSGAAVGLLTALQFLPQTLFGLTGGVIADRFPKRRLLLFTQTAMAVQSLLLGLLTLTGTITLRSLCALAIALGTATALDQPARNAFISELVDRDRVPGAVSLNAAQFNVARILGPALAGLAVATAGPGPVFLANTASYSAVLYGLITIRPGELVTPAASSPRDSGLRDALRHIAATPELLLPITIIGFVGTFGLNFQVTIAVVAVTVFHTGSAAFGYLSAAYAAGSLIGALRGAAGGRPPTARNLIASTVVFGLLEATVGLMPGYVTFLILLIPTGLAGATATTTANALTQLKADPHLRGRVMSVYFLVLLGGTPLGAPLVGWVSDTLGARYSLILGGLVSAAAALVLPRLITYRARPATRSGPLSTTVTEETLTGTPVRPIRRFPR
ncbi:MFS transporter [Streptomyces sp. Ag109_G2-15]|uniref:MFS transporter n=1 Tax=Streptomyces sp. Ag109_G2-15 TaxID=1938850 RepID=UPI000BCFA17D|nr:MFS transporter [Streptomyces sp. Ag109_G2-15]SOE06727.1 Predicted arabinose efflux permease, MFS family [Streptomyces sp. Ag109_G2-15]